MALRSYCRRTNVDELRSPGKAEAYPTKAAQGMIQQATCITYHSRFFARVRAALRADA